MPGYPPEIRLRKKAEYDLVLSLELRVSDSNLTLFGMPNQLGYSRFGMIVSKKQGNAVKRNRRKRLLREAIRLNRQHYPQGIDFVIIPRVGQPPTYTSDCSSLLHLTKKLARKFESP